MTLDIQTIKDNYTFSRYYNKGSGLIWVLLGVVAIIYICVILSQNIMAIITVPIFLFPFCGIYIWYYIVTNSVAKALEANNFYICEDICTDKKIILDDDSKKTPVGCVLYFQNYKKYSSSHTSEYENCRKGESFYVVLCGKSKKIRFIFKQNEWNISLSDFKKSGNAYIPKKQ